ncbi:hypothetical protein TNCV_416171 [Trichonephila clavipes]|nr:hypothetical protein TNCV_416171 [Trichonephila clavipes]
MLWGGKLLVETILTNKNTLIRALTEEWDKLPQQLLDNVVQVYCRTHKSRYQVPIAELAERWTELPQVSDESRSFFRVHTGYFSNIPKCIKAEFIASWACSQSSVVSSSQR